MKIIQAKKKKEKKKIKKIEIILLRDISQEKMKMIKFQKN